MKKPDGGTEDRLQGEIRDPTGKIRKLRQELRECLNEQQELEADDKPHPRRGTKKREPRADT